MNGPKARAAAANLRHGFYSKSAEVALTALGEDPAEFKRRLESLIETYQPANALEMGLVMQLARALWRNGALSPRGGKPGGKELEGRAEK
jgi:hypothetical protein